MITIASVVKDVERFLPKALECWSEVADRIRVIDNMSSDATLDILNECDHSDLRWASCTTPMDGNEWRVRRELWNYARDGAEWVVHLDADHVVADEFREHLPDDFNAVAFWMYEMWADGRHRDDKLWKPRPWWRAVNVKKFTHADSFWEWNERGWHSGHLPSNFDVFGPAVLMPQECAILHYGYATPELRIKHHEAYMNRREHLEPMEVFHARSILWPEPHTSVLPFEPRWSLL